MIETSVLFFALVSGVDCNFESAFEKGAADAEAGSYGANLDRYCKWASAEARSKFPSQYALGREQGPVLKKAGIRHFPKNEDELDLLLKEARNRLSTEDALNRLVNTGTATNSVDLQSVLKRLETLEAENKKLAEQLSQSEAKRLTEVPSQ